MILSLFLLALPLRAETGTAAAVVRSKEWVVRRGEAREEEFIGDVRYDAASTHLSADWALYRHARKEWQARGRVLLRKDLENGDRVEARGEKARYDENSEVGILEPRLGARVEFLHTPAVGEPDHAEGDLLSWKGESEATLSGGAHGWGPRAEFWADTARYLNSERRLKLAGGRPVLRKIEGEWTTALKADAIEATDAPRRIEASGAVRGWLLFKDEKKLKALAR